MLISRIHPAEMIGPVVGRVAFSIGLVKSVNEIGHSIAYLLQTVTVGYRSMYQG
jgi:hypothetical protein